MKYSIFMMALGIILCTACILQLIYIQEQPFRLTSPGKMKSVATSPEIRRQRITFILGEDRDQKNPYYREASSYYSTHPDGRTDYVVFSCRSLLEVRDYLEQYPPCDGNPWGLVNLVTHGNQWVGMSVKVLPHAKRSSAEEVYESVKSGKFKPLPKNILDNGSELFIHGCGLGNDHALLEALALAFGGERDRPVVRASRLFEYYSSTFVNDKMETQRYMAKAWFVSHPMGIAPSLGMLMQQFRERYPYESVDWSSALVRTAPRWTGDLYHYTFEVPVKVVIPDDQDLSLFKTRNAQLAYVACLNEISTLLNKIEMTSEDFQWQFTRVYTDNEDGTRSPAVLVKGYATMVTVLQALTVTGTDGIEKRPFLPDVDDPLYFYASN
jgi:hypothetical protein